jgi:hypothetical protein
MNCPKCLQIDQVKTVKAILAEQTTNTVSNSTTYNASGTRTLATTSGESKSVTKLVTELSQRDYPTRAGTFTLTIGVGIFLLGLASSIYAYTQAVWEIERQKALLGLWFIIPGILIGFYGYRTWKMDSGIEERIAKAKLSNKRADEASYCGRCAIRFDSEGIF